MPLTQWWGIPGAGSVHLVLTDVLMLGIVVGFFALTIAMVSFCSRVLGSDEPEPLPGSMPGTMPDREVRS